MPDKSKDKKDKKEQYDIGHKEKNYKIHDTDRSSEAVVTEEEEETGVHKESDMNEMKIKRKKWRKHI